MTLTFILACLANCQVPGETAWKIVRDPGAKANYAATDSLGDVYVVEQLSPTSAVLNIFGPYGTFLRSYPISGLASGLAVDPPTGTACIGVNGYLQAFDWDGYSWFDDESGTLIGMGMDQEGTTVGLFANSTFTYLSSDNGYFYNVVTIPFAATSGYVDSRGRCLLLGDSGGKTVDTTTANFYDVDGTLLWTRTYSHTGTSGHRFGGYGEDSRGYCYVVDNDTSLTAPTYTVEAIIPSTAQDLWQSTSFNGTVSSICTGASAVFLAGEGTSQPFITALDNNADTPNTLGTQIWTVNGQADQLVQNGNGPVALAFNSTAGTTSITNYSATTGAVMTHGVFTTPTSADEGTIVSPGSNVVVYLGDTGGASSDALIQKLVYGACLSSVSSPASVIGGTTLTCKLGFLQPVHEPTALFSSNNAVLSVPAIVAATAANFTGTTVPVDANTKVVLTAEQGYPYVERSVATTVLTAAISAMQITETTLTAPATTTGKITLTGSAGPSGKTITLSSGNAAITVPPSFKIPANSSSGTFTIASNPVPANTSAAVTASLGGVSKTLTVSVVVPVFSQLTLNPSSVVGGTGSTGHIYLNGENYAAGNADVTSSSPLVTVPTNVSIPAKAGSATFAITTKAVTTTTIVKITVTYGSTTLSQNLTLTPPAN